MKIVKQILEAIQRGINLAIDDFDDVQYDVDVQKKGYIKNKFITREYINAHNLLDKIFNLNATIEDINNFSKLSKKLGIKCKVTSRDQLYKILTHVIHVLHYYDADLNWIDTSDITDMHDLFYTSQFNGNISEWDVSNVRDMSWMFARSKFNQDISNWNVDKVIDCLNIFAYNIIKDEFKPKFKIKMEES